MAQLDFVFVIMALLAETVGAFLVSTIAQAKENVSAWALLPPNTMDTFLTEQQHIQDGMQMCFMVVSVIQDGQVSKIDINLDVIPTIDVTWAGAACSERVCDAGIDPRMTPTPHEVVTLACHCEGVCGGKFKLRFMGQSVDPWLTPNSRAYEVANALMSAPSIVQNTSAYSKIAIVAFNTSVNDHVCKNYSTTKTKISFRRSGADLPAISLYASLVTGGSVYFEVMIRVELLPLKFANAQKLKILQT